MDPIGGAGPEAADVRSLVERSRIADVIHALFVATDARDWDQVHECLAERVTFDMASLAGGEPAQRSPREITGGWEAGLRYVDSIHHQVGNLSIALQEVEATASCYGIAYHYRRTKSGRNTRVFVGSYDFHLARQRGDWRIDLFRFNLKFVDGNLELEKEPSV
jgi:hypothetical protein